MIVQGKVQGVAARKYSGYYYRQAVLTPISCGWDLDPDRVYLDREYPRYTSITQPVFKAIDLADYEFRTYPAQGGLMRMRAEVWVMPNRYGPKWLKPFLALALDFTLELDPKDVEDFAVREAFRW